MEKERNEKGSKFHDRQLLAVLGPLLSSVRADGRPDPHGFNIVQLIQLTTDVTANERAAEKWRRITSEGEALSAVGGEGGQEKEILDDNLYPVSIGFARDICSIGIHGLGAGLFTPLAPVYVGQISDPRSRSVLLRLIDVAVAFATSNRQPPPHAYLHSENHRSCLARHPPRENSLWPMNRSRQWIHLRGWESRMNRLLAGYSPTGLSRFVVQIFFVFFLNWTWSRAVVESFKIDDTWSCSGSDRSGDLPLDNERWLWSSNTGTVPSLFVSLRSSTHARYAWRISLWLVCFVDPQRRIVLGRVEKFRDQGSLYNLQSVGDSRSLGPTGTTRLCRG